MVSTNKANGANLAGKIRLLRFLIACVTPLCYNHLIKDFAPSRSALHSLSHPSRLFFAFACILAAMSLSFWNLISIFAQVAFTYANALMRFYDSNKTGRKLKLRTRAFYEECGIRNLIIAAYFLVYLIYVERLYDYFFMFQCLEDTSPISYISILLISYWLIFSSFVEAMRSHIVTNIDCLSNR